MHRRYLADIVERSLGLNPASEPVPNSGRPETVENKESSVPAQ